MSARLVGRVRVFFVVSAVVVSGCGRPSVDAVGSSVGAPSTSAAPALAPPAASTPPPAAPPTGPAALGQPRAFHFLVAGGDKPNVIVQLDFQDQERSADWLKPGAPIDLQTWGPGDGATAGALAEEEKLPSSLRLRGVVMHLYAGEKFVCDGRIGTARVGVVGEEGRTFMRSSGPTPAATALLDHVFARALLFDVDVPPHCAARLKEGPGPRWARDASLSTPVIVGHSEKLVNGAVPEGAVAAVNLARMKPAFVDAQKWTDLERRNDKLPIEPIESALFGKWTEYAWKGETRAYLAVVNRCPPPRANVGVDLRKRANGTFELVDVRNLASLLDEVPDPAVLVDVDGDGEIESIEAGESYRLASFADNRSYVWLTVEHCR